MPNFVAELLNHNDLTVHVIGWGVTLFVAGGTLLYKGIWKRINQLADAQEHTDKELNQLIGAHNTVIMMGGHSAAGQIVERREQPRKGASDERRK